MRFFNNTETNEFFNENKKALFALSFLGLIGSGAGIGLLAYSCYDSLSSPEILIPATVGFGISLCSAGIGASTALICKTAFFKENLQQPNDSSNQKYDSSLLQP